MEDKYLFLYRDLIVLLVSSWLWWTGLFGNFLGNSEKQRIEQLNVQRSTQSIWSSVFSNPAPFLQGNYQSYAGE